MNNENNLTPPSPQLNIESLSPFTRFCCSIGMIPSSYKASMTYEEQLMWLCDYLENTVIPTINNNGQVVTELQNLFVQLKSFVDNYFTNLDVQQEINNKLDEMAEDGTLISIISPYLQPIIDNQNEFLENSINSQNNRIEIIENLVNASNNINPLVASSIDEMTDTSRIYVLSTNGHWYYYNGDAWTDGGIYQAVAVSDSDPLINEMIDDINASIIKTSTKFTTVSGSGNTQLTTDGYVEHGTGNVITTDTFKVSNLLNCSPDDTIYLHALGHRISDIVAFYDKYKNYISGINFDGETSIGSIYQYASIPSNAKYCRFTMISSDAAGYINHIFRENNLKPSFDELTFSEKKYNYSDLQQLKNFIGFINLNGVETSTDAFSTTDFIYINPTNKISYRLRGNNTISLISFYDEFHQFISSLHPDTSGISDITGEIQDVPENTMYIRVSYLNDINYQFLTIYSNPLENNEFLLNYLFNKSYKNVLFQKYLACTGDSINTTTQHRPYAGFGKMIAEKYNMKYNNKSIWGGTLASNITGSSGAIVSTIEQMPNDADFILLSGGTNDLMYVAQGVEQIGSISSQFNGPFDTNTLCGALESICYQAINKWHGKKILFVITQKNLNSGVAYMQTFENCVSLMIEILKKWGIPFVDLFHDMPSLTLPSLKDLYTTNGNTEYTGTGDGLHPNENGYKIFYLPPIENKLMNI